MLEYSINNQQIIVPGNKEDTIQFAARYWIKIAKEAIEARNRFIVALSGGNSPCEIYSAVVDMELEWKKVFLFWSDERNVPITDKMSNYKMAMDSGFSKLPIAKEQIFPMKTSKSASVSTSAYEKTIKELLVFPYFDLVMLGIGADGHIASLFPNTTALNENEKIVIENINPETNQERITLSYKGIQSSRNIMVFANGIEKNHILKKVLLENDPSFPATKLTSFGPNISWILDNDAAAEIEI